MDDPTLNKRWVTRVEGESPLYEWMESGVLRQVTQDEQGTPNVEEVRGRGDGGWSEVEVWEDGGQSAASVRKEEWGVDSARARAEKGAPRKLKRLVCGGSVVCANLLRRDATARDGWEVAANPARYAVQYGKTTRSRAAIPIHKLAVKHLASLRLSRIYRPMRTLDASRPASNEDTTTRFYDLLKHTAREGGEIDEDENREWTIERIIARRPSQQMLGNFEYKVRFENAGPGDDRWLTEGEVTGPLLDRFNAAVDSVEIDGPRSNNDGDGQEDDESDNEEKGTESEHEGSEGRIARSIFGSIHDCNLPRPTSDTAYSILADALPLGPHRCRKQRRRGICDLCYLLRGETVIETTRHLALECPYTGLVHEAALRTVLEVTTLDEAVREETRRSQWQQLAHEHRRLCITGFRLTTSRGQMAEGRIGATPTRVMMLETLAGIVRRRHYNANLAHDATPDARVDSIFKDARAALVRQFYYTAKRAQQTEREIRLRIPGWQPSPGEGPVAEWERDWLASGFFSDDGQCALPERIQLARDIAANDCTSNTMALLSVEPCDRGGACRVKVRLMVEAPGVILRPCRRDGTTPPQQQQPPDWTAYTDGSEDGGRAGWAYAVVMGGDGICDVNAMLVTEGYGPVVTSPVHAAFVGARKHTNNTAELSALAELFRSLLHTAPRPAGSRGVVRTDSEYAMACATGRISPGENAQLASYLRAAWRHLASRHEVTWRHVKGHSGHKWNDYVDKQADLGRSGARDCDAPEWQDESIPTDADDGESSTVGDDVVINGGGTTIPLDDIGDGASSYADDPPDSPENRPPPSAPPSPPKAPAVEHGVIWISYTPSAQARHIGDNKGIRRERAIDIDVDPADSTDVDVITSAATALSLDDTVENRTEDLAEAIGRITLGPAPAPTPRGGGTRPCRAPLAAPGRGTPWVGAGDSHAGSPPQPPPGGNPCSQKRAPSPVSRTPLAGAADQFRERSSAGGVRFLP